MVALAALVWLIFKFGELPSMVSQMGAYNVTVRLPSAPGIERDTSVKFCGYQIGTVTRVRRPRVMENLETGEVYHQVPVTISVDDAYKEIPATVVPTVMTRGLGSSFIELRAPEYEPNAPPKEFLEDGIELQGVLGGSADILPEHIQDKLESALDEFTVLMANANEVLGDKENKENLKASLANIRRLTSKADEVIERAKKSLDTAENALKEIQGFGRDGRATLKSIEARAEVLVDALTEVSEELSGTLAETRQIMEKINSGKGSAGRFVNDGKLYESLLENVDQLQLVLKEVEEFIRHSKKKGVPLKLK